jgi:hypothetical protein
MPPLARGRRGAGFEERIELLDYEELFGGQGVNRTLDTKIFSLLLYRLSYLPTGMASVGL